MESHPDFDEVLNFLDLFYKRVYECILEEGFDAEKDYGEIVFKKDPILK
jgi:hypothetical protein